MEEYTLPKILVATNNNPKYKEIEFSFLGSGYELVSLDDLNANFPRPLEYGRTISENALIKAKHYAELSGLMTIADDTGLFVDALDGWPGVHAGQSGAAAVGRRQAMLDRMIGIPREDRRAVFRTAVAAYSPETGASFVVEKSLIGEIAEVDHQGGQGFDYDPVFIVPERGIPFSEMNLEEKMRYSSRGRALGALRHMLNNQFAPKDIVVSVSIIIKDGLILLAKRSDPYNPDFDGKWEFPGGGLKFGENPAEAAVREAREEVGLIVKAEKFLPVVHAVPVVKKGEYSYQAVLLPFLCTVEGGQEMADNREVSEVCWFSLSELPDRDQLLPNNHEFLQKIIPFIFK